MIILLCDCNKKIGSKLNLKLIKSYFEGKGHRVFIMNKPCKDIEKVLESRIDEPLIIGGCLDKGHKIKIRDKMRKKGIDSFLLSMIPLNGAGSEEIAMLLLKAAIERFKLFVGVNKNNLKPRFDRLDDRGLLKKIFMLPRFYYDIVPSIEKDKCRKISPYCELCIKKCPTKAITIDEEGKAVIEKLKCTGCGICINICPANAIIYPYFTQSEIFRELEILLNDKEFNIAERSVLFICEDSGVLLNDFLLKKGSFPESVLPVILPCIGRLSSELMLGSFILGAKSIGLVTCQKEVCRRSVKIENIQKQVSLVKAVLKAFDIEGERITVLQVDSSSDIEEKLNLWINNIKELKPINIFLNIKNLTLDDCSLIKLIQNISNITGKDVLLRGKEFAMASVGLLYLDEGRSCTLCGVCVSYCPTGALSIEADIGCRKLMFNYKNCVGCAKCIKICPEKVIRIKKIIDTEKLREGKKTLYSENDMVLCLNCKKPFINQTLFQKIKERTGFSTSVADEILKICPECRQKIMESLFPTS